LELVDAGTAADGGRATAGPAEGTGAAPTANRPTTAKPGTIRQSYTPSTELYYGTRSTARTRLPNVLPFSGERRTDARSYHGREEPRAPARGVAARLARERAAQAFIRCNGFMG
jgi:hypothetical protein